MFGKAGVSFGAIMLVLVAAGHAGANGPSVGFDAGGIMPLESRDIQLVWEHVDVPLGGGQVRCAYALENLTDAATSVSIGFVTNVPWPTEPDAYSAHYKGAGIRVSRMGRLLPVHLEALAKERWTSFLRQPPDSLPVWEVTFGPSEQVTLEISYQVSPSGGCDGRGCQREMTYFAATAQLWAGTVREAIISFTFGEIAGALAACNPDYKECLRLKASPSGYVVTTGGVRWNLSEWKPQEDVKVSIHWIDPE